MSNIPEGNRGPLSSGDSRPARYHGYDHHRNAKKKNKTDASDEPRKKRRVNRPGFNSYLKVMMDDPTMDVLHQMALDIQTELGFQEEERKRSGQPGETTTADNSRSPNETGSSSSKKDLRFKPRSRNSLHMTLFFGGETICELPPNELSEWHNRISSRMAKSGFCLLGDDHTNPRESNISGNDYSFRIEGLKVFPPQRNNLIVVILEAPPLWHLLHDDIRRISQDESCSTALAEVTKYSKNKWVAHITLGNLIGGPKSKINALGNSLLKGVFDKYASLADDSPDTRFSLTSNPTGIGMGGPIPGQVKLDWNFRYSPVTAQDLRKNEPSPQAKNSPPAVDSTSANTNVSERCVRALTPSSAYADAFMKAMAYQYDPDTRPDGFVPLCVAENKLSIDLLTTKLTEAQVISAAFSDPDAYCYNSFLGLLSARQAASRFIAKRFLCKEDTSMLTDPGCSSIEPSHIGIGSGAAGILHSLFYLLGSRGDCCLIPTPYYAAFENQMSLVADISPFGFQIANSTSGPTESELDLAYKASCARGLNPKFVLITNPHNPLGIIYKPEVIATIVTWARNQNLHTIVDEVYALSTHQKHGHGFRSVINILDNQLEDNVHWLWSMSKDFGASGLRIGYVYSQNETFLKGFSNLNGFSGVSQPMQLLVSNVLSDDTFVDSYLDQSRERVLRNYKACTQILDAMRLPYVPAVAGLFVYVDFSSLLPEKTVEYESSLSNLVAEHARVLLTPGQSQKDGRPGMFRICYAWVTPEELNIAMERLSRLVERLRMTNWDDIDAESIGNII